MEKNGKMDRDEAKKWIMQRWSTSSGDTIKKMVKRFSAKYWKEKKPEGATYKDALEIFKS